MYPYELRWYMILKISVCERLVTSGAQDAGRFPTEAKSEQGTQNYLTLLPG